MCTLFVGGLLIEQREAGFNTTIIDFVDFNPCSSKVF